MGVKDFEDIFFSRFMKNFSHFVKEDFILKQYSGILQLKNMNSSDQLFIFVLDYQSVHICKSA